MLDEKAIVKEIMDAYKLGQPKPKVQLFVGIPNESTTHVLIGETEIEEDYCKYEERL